MERGKPLGFHAQLAPCRRGEAPERLQPDASALVLPGPGDLAVDQEGVDRMRGLGVEDDRPVALRQDPGSPRVDQQGRVPDRKESSRGGSLGIGEGRAGKVQQLLAVLGAKAAQAKALERRRDLLRPQARPSRRSRFARPGRSRPGSGAPEARWLPGGSPPPVPATPPPPRTGRLGVAPRCPRAGPGRARATDRRRWSPRFPCRGAGRSRRGAAARRQAWPADAWPAPPSGARSGPRGGTAATPPCDRAGWRARTASSRARTRGGSSSASAFPGRPFAARAPESDRRAAALRPSTTALCTSRARTGPAGRRRARGPAAAATGPARAAAGGRAAPGSARAG